MWGAFQLDDNGIPSWSSADRFNIIRNLSIARGDFSKPKPLFFPAWGSNLKRRNFGSGFFYSTA
ncbi:hypothetical protein C4J81_09815 [Deltaproteobacteria bacterium Smac51]|nr:hypothetical protein C4J81_09815 [Deltaproteobacteria bacterium Smac51]